MDASAEAELGGLLAGWVLQDFELEDMEGGTRTLSSYRGLPLLLLFFDPSCAFCKAMLPELAALVPADDLQVLIVSTGDADENRALFAPFSLRFPSCCRRTWSWQRCTTCPAPPWATWSTNVA